MKRKNLLILLSNFLCFVLLFTSCKYGLEQFLFRKYDVNSRSTSIEKIDSPFEGSLPQNYKILLLADLHFGKGKTNVKEKLFSYLDELKSEGKELPSFALVLGDIADTGSDFEFNQYKILLDDLETRYGITKVMEL